ncbi:MAG: hypothetical protein ABF662_09265 [Liquorilactobacillus satsumensis]
MEPQILCGAAMASWRKVQCRHSFFEFNKKFSFYKVWLLTEVDRLFMLFSVTIRVSMETGSVFFGSMGKVFGKH